MEQTENSKAKKREDAATNFWAKTFITKQDFVVAVCDEEVLEKELSFKYHEKKDPVKIKLSKNFYGGMVVDESIVIKLLRRATIGNIMGKRAIDLAEKNGFIIRENIILIDGVPHGQFIKISKIR